MRSKLFVPASRPELFAKAEAGEADALSFDLEDAVAESRKEEARGLLAQHLKQRKSGKETIVRVNAPDTPWFEADVEATVRAGVDIINLPMAENAGQVRMLSDRIAKYESAGGRTRILVNIETPAGLRNAAALAAADSRVMGLQIGFADLLEPYGFDRGDEAVLSHVRITVRFAAAAANVQAYDAAFARTNDPEAFRRECAAARRQGYAGKSCVHPSQVPIANQEFMPSEREVERARKIVAAAAEAEAKGVGAFLVDGHMIDKPFILRAQAILAMARTG